MSDSAATKRQQPHAEQATTPAVDGDTATSKKRKFANASSSLQIRARAHRTAEKLCNYCVHKDTNLLRSHIEDQLFVICDKTLPDCPIQYASDGFIELTGYPREEVLGRNCRFLQGPGTDPRSVCIIRTALKRNEPLTINLLNYKKNGEEFWNMLQLTPVKDYKGVCTAYVGCQQEIEPLGPMDDALLLSATSTSAVPSTLAQIESLFQCEADQKLLFTQMPVSSLSYAIANPNLPDCPMTHVSDAFLRMTGYSREECIGRNCRFLQGKDTDPETVQRLREAIKTGCSITVKILNYKKNGTPFWNMLHLSAVVDVAGKVVRFIGAQSDMTEEYTETMNGSTPSSFYANELNKLSESIMELVDEPEVAATARTGPAVAAGTTAGNGTTTPTGAASSASAEVVDSASAADKAAADAFFESL